MRKEFPSSFVPDARSKPLVSYCPEVIGWAIRGKLPWIVRREQETEIECAVSRTSGQGFDVSAWILGKMREQRLPTAMVDYLGRLAGGREGATRLISGLFWR